MKQRTNMVSIFPQDIRFYRNDENDIYLKCVCGHHETIANAEIANDEIAAKMRKAMDNHVCANEKTMAA